MVFCSHIVKPYTSHVAVSLRAHGGARQATVVVHLTKFEKVQDTVVLSQEVGTEHTTWLRDKRTPGRGWSFSAFIQQKGTREQG